MSSREREERQATLITYLHGLDYAALTRVVEAEKWIGSPFWDVRDPSSKCLVGHAEAVNGKTFGAFTARLATSPNSIMARAWLAFEALCEGQGIARTVAEVQSLAAVLLHDREEAVVVALLQPALCPLAAREEAGV